MRILIFGDDTTRSQLIGAAAMRGCPDAVVSQAPADADPAHAIDKTRPALVILAPGATDRAAVLEWYACCAAAGQSFHSC